MTKVTCSSCGVECEVPFKPTSNKPIYCSDCFAKKGGKSGSGRNSSINLDEINEKLDKIMEALKIE
jgi:CxxC-x17-CxxC domain-containing protein